MATIERKETTYTALDGSCWGALVRQSLDRIPPADNVHERHSRYLSNASTQLAIASGDNVAPVGGYPLDEAVICVCSGVRAG